jgi:indoleamine 2,3-dioxygenase
MSTTNVTSHDLSDFEISPEQGFLPQDPPTELPDAPTLNHLGHELPKLLSARMVRRFIDEQRQLLPSIPTSWRDQDYRAAMRILSFAGHAYVWEVPDQPAATLPPQLAQPWHEVAQRLGRPPVLSYASYALDNWRRLDRTKPIRLDNILLLQNFLGGLDEEWFVVVHIQIEREAGPGLAGLLQALKGAVTDQEDEVRLGHSQCSLTAHARRDQIAP